MSTPFEGLNYMSLSGSLLTEPDHYEVTLAYNSDGYTVHLKGIYNDGHSDEIKPYGELPPEVSTYVLGGLINDQKVTAEASLATACCFKYNISLSIETPFDFLRQAKVFHRFEEKYLGEDEDTFEKIQLQETSLVYNEFEFAAKYNFHSNTVMLL